MAEEERSNHDELRAWTVERVRAELPRLGSLSQREPQHRHLRRPSSQRFVRHAAAIRYRMPADLEIVPPWVRTLPIERRGGEQGFNALMAAIGRDDRCFELVGDGSYAFFVVAPAAKFVPLAERLQIPLDRDSASARDAAKALHASGAEQLHTEMSRALPRAAQPPYSRGNGAVAVSP